MWSNSNHNPHRESPLNKLLAKRSLELHHFTAGTLERSRKPFTCTKQNKKPPADCERLLRDVLTLDEVS